MKRRELLRAGVLASAAAALPRTPPLAQNTAPSPELTPAQSGVDASKDLAAPGWKPLFLDAHQNETLIVLSDLILPATDTPGAKEALVNRYIDLVLAAETPETQRAFLNSLGYLDGESMRRYQAAFRYLKREDQDDLLHALAYPRANSGWTGEAGGPDVGHGHFEQLKQRIITAYYSSQTGERELGWDGAFAHGSYEGCAISPKEFTEHMPSYKLRYRDHSPEIVRTRPVQKQCYACMEYNYEWFVNDLENPYSTPAGKPFTWQRLRVLGGRSLVWGRQSYRLSDADFKAASRDGYGDDWPISYADLAPYYDIVERYVGISGAAEGNEMLPDGRFLPPMKMSCGEVLLRERVKAKFGYTVTIGRAAVLTQNYNGRLACHYCGPCERGCMTFSYFSSPFTTVKDAVASGKCTLITNAVVSHVDMDNALNMCAGARIHAHPAEFVYAGISQRTGQLERRARSLFDGPRRWRRRLGPSAGF